MHVAFGLYCYLMILGCMCVVFRFYLLLLIEPAVVDDLIDDIEKLVRMFAEISKN